MEAGRVPDLKDVLSQLMSYDEKRVVEMPDGSRLLPLTSPVGDLKSLTIRRTTGADLLAVDGIVSTQLNSQTLISRLASIPLDVVAKLDVYDLSQANAVVGSFFVKSRQTGVPS